MATARAIANGNWSSTSTWNGGVVPGNGETVFANGFNVNLDVDIFIGGANNPTVNTGSLVSGQWYEVVNVGGQNWTTLGAASNTVGTVFQSTGTGTAGNLGTARALATLTTATNTAAGATTGGGVFTMSTVRAMTCDLRAGTTTCLSVTGATALTLDGLRVVGGSAAGVHGCNYSGTTTCSLASCTFTGGSNGSAHALNNASTGTVTVSGSCTFTAATGSALNNASTGTINVSASSTFTGGASNSNVLNNASTGTVNITASCAFTGGAGASGLSIALNNASTGSVNVSAPCTFTAGSTLNSFGLNNNSTGAVIVTQSTFTASAFTNAVSVTNTAADVRLSGDFFDHWSGWKAVNGTKWRLGTAPTLGQTRYALAGTTDSYFTMYGSDNGAFGNPIAANVRSGVSYGGGNLTGTCAVPAAGSVALGVPVDATTGTAVLTPAALRAELATELARLDAPVSAAGNAPSAATVASAVWGAAARTITGGSVDTLVNSPDVPTESEIAAAVWSKPTTELTITGSIGERAKNQSTVSTTGAQLAAALS